MPDTAGLKELRAWLGAHRGLRAGQLTEREAATLVVCAGRAAGFIVRTEVMVHAPLRTGGTARGEIDVGWFHPVTNQLLAAWELDGQDADEGHFRGVSTQKRETAGNKAKFDACIARLKIQVLYSVKNNLEPKRSSRQSLIEGWLGTSAVVVTDEELMGDPGILDWIRRAQTCGQDSPSTATAACGT